MRNDITNHQRVCVRACLLNDEDWTFLLVGIVLVPKVSQKYVSRSSADKTLLSLCLILSVLQNVMRITRLLIDDIQSKCVMIFRTRHANSGVQRDILTHNAVTSIIMTFSGCEQCCQVPLFQSRHDTHDWNEAQISSQTQLTWSEVKWV